VPNYSIHIHDASVELWQAGERLAAEPGFALIHGAEVHVGHAARSRARLVPRQIYSDFWSRLGTDPLPDPRAGGRSGADLAYLQLSNLWSEHGGSPGDSVVLCVPNDLSPEQLSLLLGIARAAEIPVRALIPTALASAERERPERQLVFLDAGLHRTLAVELEQAGGASSRSLARHASGLEALRETWLRHVVKRFIEITRFDPSHSADSEQALYDQLPEWIAALRTDGAIKILLESDRTPLQLEIARTEMIRAAEPHYQEWRRFVSAVRSPGSPLTLLLSPQLAELPGFAEALLEMQDVEVVPLPAETAPSNALAHFSATPEVEGEAQMLTRVSWLGASASAAELPARRSPASAPAATLSNASGATHVVFEGVAHSIDARGLCVGSNPGAGTPGLSVPAAAGVSRRHAELVREGRQLVLRDLSRYGCFVNDRRVDSEQVLQAGDRLRLGTPGVELLLIRLAGESR